MKQWILKNGFDKTQSWEEKDLLLLKDLLDSVGALILPVLEDPMTCLTDHNRS